MIYIIMAVICITKKKYGFMGVIIPIYHILFFCLPGIFHIYYSKFPFYNINYPDEIQVQASFLILIYTIFLTSGFFIQMRSVEAFSEMESEINLVDIISKNKLIFIFFTICIIQISFILILGPASFIVRREDIDYSNFGSEGYMAAIIFNTARALSFCDVMLLLMSYKVCGKGIFTLLFILLMPIFLIINYPLALPRFTFFSYFLFAFYLVMKPSTKNKLILFLIFAIGLTTVFPLFSFLTRGDADSEFTFSLADYYTGSGDFDGLQSVLNVLLFVRDNSFQYGHQLLGAIFIFVPRIFWPEKPNSTGSITADHAGYLFTNISSPLPAELYIDFGYIGIILLPIIIGWAIRKLDWFTINKNHHNDFTKHYMAAIYFSFSIIIFRGSLIAVIAPIAIQCLLAYCVLKFIKRSN